MSTITQISLTVTAEADAYIDEIGQRETFVRMLDQIPAHYAGVREIAVTLGVDYDEGGPLTVLFEITRDDPGQYDGADRLWDRWVIENFTPDQFVHFVLFSFRT